MKRIVFAIMTIIVISCTKTNEDIDIIDTPVKEYSVQEKTELISSYAQMLAASLHNPELRSTIKKEAQLKFDGDYDVLTSKLNNIRLSDNNMTIKHMLSNTCIMTRSNESGFKGNLEELVAEIQTTFPNLQVAVPVHCDEWDTRNYTPLVAFLPYDYDDQTATEIEAFDINGNSFMLSLEEEPEQPVIVVSISERVDRNGKLKNSYVDFEQYNSIETKAAPVTPTGLNLFHSGAGKLELEWLEVSGAKEYFVYRKMETETSYTKIGAVDDTTNYYIDSNLTPGEKYSYRVRSKNSDGSSALSTAISTFASFRNDGELLRIKRMSFTEDALKSVEKWGSGAPEIRLRVVYGADDPARAITTGRLEPAQRNDIKDCWWENPVSIGTWATSVMGTVLTFDWREEDWDDDVTFTITASVESKIAPWSVAAGGSLTISGDDGGDVIGSTLVYFWDKKDMEYDVSGFKWEFE